MIKVVFCLRRRPDLTREQFQRYWSEQHGPVGVRLAAQLGFQRYVQSHTVDSGLNDALQTGRGAPEAFDGVVELWYDDESAVETTFATPEGRQAARTMLADEANFIDTAMSPIFLVEERQLFPPA